MKRNMIVSIIGRPNVGKSSLFNRILGNAHKAITFDRPGVTRDRHYAVAKLNSDPTLADQEIILIDTGGFYPEAIQPPKVAPKDSSYKDLQKIQDDKFFQIMTEHAKMAIDESDLVLLITDIREGLSPFDEQIALYLRKFKKTFWVLVNKYDSDRQEAEMSDFFTLPVSDLFFVSAAHGRGVEEVKDKIQKMAVEFSPEDNKIQMGVTPREEVVARVALIGAPNAGKSTLLNKLVGAQRALVSEIAGTTVDPIEGFFDLYFGPEVKKLSRFAESHDDHLLIREYEDYQKMNPNYQEDYQEDDEVQNADEEGFIEDSTVEETILPVNIQNFSEDGEDADEGKTQNEEESNHWRSIHLIDTAGIRRKGQMKGFVETQSVYRALRCITESDIVLFLVDATKGISHQDRRLLDIAGEKGKSIIILLNKFDLVQSKFKTPKDLKEWISDLRYPIPWLYYCDLIPISAKSGHHLGHLKKSLVKTILTRYQKIPTPKLNSVLSELIDAHQIYLRGAINSTFKVRYSSMVKSDPPTVLLFCNRIKGLPDHYRRYLQNGLRKHFEFANTPIHLVLKKTGELKNKT